MQGVDGIVIPEEEDEDEDHGDIEDSNSDDEEDDDDADDLQYDDNGEPKIVELKEETGLEAAGQGPPPPPPPPKRLPHTRFPTRVAALELESKQLELELLALEGRRKLLRTREEKLLLSWSVTA
jgi:hypothetical protein